MAGTDLYKDISSRSGGDIYIGVVGAVRCGKSTFVKKFMEIAVLPSIENKYKLMRATDELPQSGSGKMITTVEPKFVPNEAVKLSLGDGTGMNVRLIDCVGYVVKGAVGDTEDSLPRMIRTPWSDSEMPFEKAAETGTRKVISEHSTIGIVMTTDGSFTDIPRESYIPAEERVIDELRALEKPFVVILNTMYPYSQKTQKLREEMQEKYSLPVITVDVLNMTQEDIENILTEVLYEFPVTKTEYTVPRWVTNLPSKHYLITQINDFLSSISSGGRQIRSIRCGIRDNVNENFCIHIENTDLSTGTLSGRIEIDSSIFYKIISEENGVAINSESDMYNLLTELLSSRKSVRSLQAAMEASGGAGYGIVYPTVDSFTLSPPEMTSDGGKFGIRLCAKAYSTHLITGEIISEINPMIGQESECELFYQKLIQLYENDRDKLWETEIFGRSIADMFSDDVYSRLNSIPEDTRGKLSRLIGKVANSGKGGLVVFWI